MNLVHFSIATEDSHRCVNSQGIPKSKGRWRVMASTTVDSKRLNPNQDSNIICEIIEYNQSGHEVATYVNTNNDNGDGFRIDVVVSTRLWRINLCYYFLVSKVT